MKKLLIFDHNCVCLFLRDKFEMAKNVDEADVVVLWQDVLGIEKGVAELAKMKGKKVVVLQHGRNATVDYANYPLIADKICVWGPKDMERLKSYGIENKRIELTGTDVLSHTKPREKHEGINVVMRPIHWDTYCVEENIILRDALRKIDSINITTKCTEAHNPKDFDNPVCSYRDNFDHLDICADVLAKADVVVGAGEDGTFEMMAFEMDIPVIIADIWKPKTFLGRPPQEAVYTEACEVCELEDLGEVVLNTIANHDKLRSQRRKVAYEEGGVGLNTPSESIIKVINSL
jgi:hypothetical protein